MLFNLFNSHCISILFQGFRSSRRFTSFTWKPTIQKPENLKKPKTSKPQNLSFFYGWEYFIFWIFSFFSFFSSHFAPLAKLIFKNLKNGILTHATTFLLKKSSSFFLWIVLQLPPTVLSFALLSCQRRPLTTYCPTLKCEVLGGTQRNQRSAVPTQSIAEWFASLSFYFSPCWQWCQRRRQLWPPWPPRSFTKPVKLS